MNVLKLQYKTVASHYNYVFIDSDRQRTSVAAKNCSYEAVFEGITGFAYNVIKEPIAIEKVSAK